MSDSKRKKNYYAPSQNKKMFNKRAFLDAGMKGFLCTCNFCEKDCVRDSYKILNEYLDRQKSVETPEEKPKSDVVKDEEKPETQDETHKDEDEDDISTSLRREIDHLKADTRRTFQAVDTGVKNMIFIQSSVSNPLDLALPIIKEAFETKKKKSRFILRLLPIEVVCKAYVDVIKAKADPLFDEYFVKEPKTFAIVFNRHSNNSLQRTEVITELADLISKKNPENKVDLTTPQLTVVLEILRSFCLISIAPNYNLYKKYNLTELYGVEQKKKEKNEEEESTEAIDGDGEVKNDSEDKSEEPENEEGD